MTLTEFKQALIDMGYKEIYKRDGGSHIHTSFRKQNKRITTQKWDTHTNVFYDKNIKNGAIEYTQLAVKNFAKALANIKKFERKIK